VFCGSSVGSRPTYSEAARRLGTCIAERGLRLIYGGGKVGLMGLLAESVHLDGIVDDHGPHHTPRVRWRSGTGGQEPEVFIV
jgi:predicted Rossmann-fold nucleotide-binding protein